MSDSHRRTSPGAARTWLAIAAFAGIAGLPASAAASPCGDLAVCLAQCGDATCQQSCLLAAGAETRDLLHALVDCNNENCPPGSPAGCRYEFCPEQLRACGLPLREPTAPWAAPVGPPPAVLVQPAGDVEVPSSMQGGMLTVGFGRASIAVEDHDVYPADMVIEGAFQLAYNIGWDGNWLFGEPTSASLLNAGAGLALDLGFKSDGDDYHLLVAGYAYFHYFFPNDLTDDVWTFIGLGLHLEAGKDNWTTETPFFAPQATLAFRWLGPYTMHVEAFAGPELWFVDDTDVGVTAGVRFRVGFQVGVGRL